MSSDKTERKKEKNFTQEEIDYLVTLICKLVFLIYKYLNLIIAESKSTLESKKTDANFKKIKEQLWEELEVQYRTFFASDRSTSSIQTKWENLKKDVKKKLTKERHAKEDEARTKFHEPINE